MIEVIGAPFDLCGRQPGSRLGPIAMRLEGLLPGLRRIGHEILDTGAVTDVDGWISDEEEQTYATANDVYVELQERVGRAIERSHTPLVLGGDHSISIGSVSGALKKFGDGLAVLWIDAHMDLNTPDTSPSGNLHGMPLAALSGLQTEVGGALGDQWRALIEDVVGPTPLSPEKIAWLGLRDVDKGEIANMERLEGSLAITMQDVDALGVAGAMERIDRHMRDAGAKALWVSFDVDSLDPIYAPGTGTAVRGGLTYREGHLIAETLHRLTREGAPYALAGLDVVEVNPLADKRNETAIVAMEWVLSIFGKTILSPDDPGRTER
ncbi:MAG: arginase [Armatimonadetes bacterium]|nr:arginase [Armatimonadota bacterium]